MTKTVCSLRVPEAFQAGTNLFSGEEGFLILLIRQAYTCTLARLRGPDRLVHLTERMWGRHWAAGRVELEGKEGEN